jgi:hypothetical protein
MWKKVLRWTLLRIISLGQPYLTAYIASSRHELVNALNSMDDAAVAKQILDGLKEQADKLKEGSV